MVQIVGNLEWELLKNVEIRKSIYPVLQTLDSWTPFSRMSPISRKNYIFSLLKTAPYARKYHFSDTAQNPD